MSILLSYEDADIYQRDLELFEDGKWLNDACIHYCFKRIENEYKRKGSEIQAKIILLDPSLVSFMLIQAVDREENEELAASLDVASKQWILAPVNDCDSFTSSSNHWSLLLCHLPSGFMAHFDSSGSYNHKAACKTATRIACLIGRECAPVFEFKSPQQRNGYDCGVYTVLFARFIYEKLVEGATTTGRADLLATMQEAAIHRDCVFEQQLYSEVDSLKAQEFRQKCKQEIAELSARYLQMKHSN
mmetsp:Transcript_717/g.1237  ORF Transcript_717/g.1237 Transcript_717/m.1237 type:complete len:245 (+) Transcript_717:82-816(+)